MGKGGGLGGGYIPQIRLHAEPFTPPPLPVSTRFLRRRELTAEVRAGGEERNYVCSRSSQPERISRAAAQSTTAQFEGHY